MKMTRDQVVIAFNECCQSPRFGFHNFIKVIDCSSERKLRLMATGLAQIPSIVSNYPHPSCLKLVVGLENYADGKELSQDLRDSFIFDFDKLSAQQLLFANISHYCSFTTVVAVPFVLKQIVYIENKQITQDAIDVILHSLIEPLDQSRKTSTVVALAEGIYENKAWDRMPILADALQDAGEDSEILNELRQKSYWFRGCNILDQILDKS